MEMCQTEWRSRCGVEEKQLESSVVKPRARQQKNTLKKPEEILLEQNNVEKAERKEQVNQHAIKDGSMKISIDGKNRLLLIMQQNQNELKKCLDRGNGKR